MFSRTTRLIIELLTMSLAIAAVIVAITVWRLSAGPIPLDFLTPMIERALSAEDGSIVVDIDDTLLAWGGQLRPLDIRIRGVSVLGRDGAQLAHVPEISVSLSVRALAQGLIAPTRLEIIAPHLLLVRGADGAVKLSPEGERGEGASIVTMLLKEITSPPDMARAMGYLARVSIVRAELTLNDIGSGRTWRASQAEIAVTRDAAGLYAEASLAVELGERTARLSATGLYNVESGVLGLDVALSDLELDSLGTVHPAAAQLSHLKLPVTGLLRLRLDATGHILATSVDLTGGAGQLASSEFYPEPVAIRGVRFRALLPEGASELRIEEFAVDLDGPTIAAEGRLTALDSRPHLASKITVRNVPTDALQRLWPRGVGENTRRWITANLTGGQVEETNVEVALRANGPSLESFEVERLSGDLRVSGVNVNYLSPMPNVRGVDGTGIITQERLDLAIGAGGIGNLRVVDAKIALTGFQAKDQQAAIEVSVQGPLRETLQLIDGPPLGYMRAIGHVPDDYAGEAAVRLTLQFPLIGRLKVEQIQIAATADVTKFTQHNAALGQDVRDGTVRVNVDNRGLDMSGQVVLGAVPAQIEYKRSFAVGASPVGRLKARGRVTTADRTAFGIDLASNLDGPTDVEVAVDEQRGRRSDVIVDARLDDATVSVPEIAWTKARGIPGTAHIELRVVEDRLREMPAFEVKAADLIARGHAGFAADGKTLAYTEFDALRFGSTDLTGTIGRDGESLTFDFAGRSLDAGPFLRDRGSPTSDRLPLNLRLVADRVFLAADRWLDHVAMAGHRSRERWEEIEFTAVPPQTIATDSRVNLSLRTNQSRQTLVIATEDAGAILKALDVTPNVLGGRLEVSGATDEQHSGRPLAGKVEMKDFRVIKAPVLARVLSVALLTGIVDALSGEGIGFARLDGEFAFDDPKLGIKEARASGSAIGITASGTIDVTAETIELSGTIVPAYAVNSLLGKIPLIGGVLTGGQRGGGVFATNYKVSGPVQNATVSVNALSTLAPSFLKGLFGVIEGGTSPEGLDPHPEPGQTIPPGQPNTPTPP